MGLTYDFSADVIPEDEFVLVVFVVTYPRFRVYKQNLSIAYE